MRFIIGRCNNHNCSQCHDGVCCLVSTIVHEFQYDHDTGLVSCQFYADEQAERRTADETFASKTM